MKTKDFLLPSGTLLIHNLILNQRNRPVTYKIIILVRKKITACSKKSNRYSTVGIIFTKMIFFFFIKLKTALTDCKGELFVDPCQFESFADDKLDFTERKGYVFKKLENFFFFLRIKSVY